jgi:electron transport complex protein RnfD
LIFGLLIGVLIVVIRLYGGTAGAVAFAILIGNAFVPLLDKLFKPKRFGEVAAA